MRSPQRLARTAGLLYLIAALLLATQTPCTNIAVITMLFWLLVKGVKTPQQDGQTPLPA